MIAPSAQIMSLGPLQPAQTQETTFSDDRQQNAEIRANLGQAKEMLGQTEGAIQEYRTAVDIDPTLTRLHYVLARLYRKLGRTDLAILEFRAFQQAEADERKKRTEKTLSPYELRSVY